MSFDQRAPSLAVTESQWLLTYQERQLPLGEWQTYLSSGDLTESGPGLGERNQRLLLSSDPQIDVTVATSYDGGVDGAGNLCLGGAGFGRFAAAIGSVSATGTYTLTFDPGMISQPNGAVAALPGETWYFQAWFRDAGGAGVATSNLSNGVAIEFVP